MKRLLIALLMTVLVEDVFAQTKIDDLSEIAPMEYAYMEMYAFKETTQACYIKAPCSPRHRRVNALLRS